uniref:Uncharacterized protein n=1 Tax=viral metagenome TaxID=1070528 RepID=A0A6M3LCF0_9ZZZZ
MPAQAVHINWGVICYGCARSPEEPDGECPYASLTVCRVLPLSAYIGCFNWIHPDDHKALMLEPTEVRNA